MTGRLILALRPYLKISYCPFTLDILPFLYLTVPDSPYYAYASAVTQEGAFDEAGLRCRSRVAGLSGGEEESPAAPASVALMESGYSASVFDRGMCYSFLALPLHSGHQGTKAQGHFRDHGIISQLLRC